MDNDGEGIVKCPHYLDNQGLCHQCGTMLDPYLWELYTGNTQMTKQTYGLADVDGTLCVTCTTPAWDKPELITNHWPTTISTYQFLRYQDSTTLADFTLFGGSLPGEYTITDNRRAAWNSQRYPITTTHGGRTATLSTPRAPARPTPPLPAPEASNFLLTPP